MREWNLKSGDPLSLTLASDARLAPTSYTDDHIWELSLGGGDPPALGLQTSFGLRAKSFRIFPRFTEGENTLVNPIEFNHLPVIRYVMPNFVALDFCSFPGIDVLAEYWVPQPKTVGGRFWFTNRSEATRSTQLEIIGQLNPTDGMRMAATEVHAAMVLAGETGGLAPVIFLTGGPQPGSGAYPSLRIQLDLSPGETRIVTWTQAALTNVEASFELARQVAASRWDAERARLDLLNAGQIEIFTGDPDWDAALMFSQKLAISLVVGPTERLPYPSFVLARQPDQGNSLRGDGSDYSHLWNGQPSLEAYFLSGFLLPGDSNSAIGIFKNYLAVQTDDGWIDWKPGLAGQHSNILATPILSSLAWRIYQQTDNLQFVADVFQGLLKFLAVWFSSSHDRDSDGIPEWDHILQSGSEDHPAYSRWHEWSYGVDIISAESPALCAYLYRECDCLIQMANLVGQTQLIPELSALKERMRGAVESAWDETLSCYMDVDRDTHYSTRREFLGRNYGTGTISLQRSFVHPIRIHLRIQTHDGLNRRPRLVIHGTGASGQHRIEVINEDRFNWLLGKCSYTGERVYKYIETIEILELEPGDLVECFSAGYDHIDQTCLLPLWAGIPADERAKKLIENTIADPSMFWRPAGLPMCVEKESPEETELILNVQPMWNSLIGEGLVRYGYRELAVELTGRLIRNAVKSLKQENAFRRFYQADSGRGLGEPNILHGLAPLNLFMETLGVRIISPQRVVLNGFNPFLWPVTVKYRGLTVLCQKDKTTVIFHDGQTVVIDDPAPCTIALQPSAS
jgi:hypothetical protein